MPIRKGDDSKEFVDKLKSPPKPINDTSASPEMENYLNDLNDGRLKSKETKEKEEKQQKEAEEAKKYKLFCPTCRRPTLKKGHQGYNCGYCGLNTNSPLRMSEEKREIRG